MRTRAAVLVAALGISLGFAAQVNDPENPYELRGVAELGYFGVLSHEIQFGKGARGTKFDYVSEGRQNTLFPFQRASVEMHLKPRHTLVLLYQPLDLRTSTKLQNDLLLDSVLFSSGTALDLRYGFDFYRLSWLYDFWSAPDRELALGLSLQLRNAVIGFTSADGRLRQVYTDVGPVPILKGRALLPVNDRMWAAAEVDGFYAQGNIITGSTNVESAFRGSILDASLRYGLRLSESVDAFFNARYLGGGAEGTQKNPENPQSDGYTSNWLNAFSLSIGLTIR